MGEESYYANREGEPRVLNKVEHVEVDREVVSGVSPSNVVQICLLDELTAIAVQKMRNPATHIKTVNAKSHDPSKPIRCELCGTVGNRVNPQLDNCNILKIDAPYRDPFKLTMRITAL